MIPIIVLYALSTFSLTSALLSYTQPFFLLGIRMSIAGILLALFCYARNHLKFTRAHWPLYAQIILFTIFIPYCLRYYGLFNTPTPRALLLYNLGPIITYLLAARCGIETITRYKTSILGLGLCGLLLFLGHPLQHYMNGGFGFGELALLLSVASFSYGWIVMRKLIVDLDYSPALANVIAMTGGGLLGLGAAFSFEATPFVTELAPFGLLLAATIIISNFGAHNLYAALLKNYSLTFLQLGSWLTPIIMQLGRCIFFTEAITWNTIGAALLVGTSILLWYATEKMNLEIAKEATCI